MTLGILEFGNTVFLFVFLFCTLHIALDFREWTWLTSVALPGREKKRSCLTRVVAPRHQQAFFDLVDGGRLLFVYALLHRHPGRVWAHQHDGRHLLDVRRQRASV